MKNKINHLHFESLPSTQGHLLKLLNESCEVGNSSTLITAQTQTAGFGRKGNHWDHLQNGLAMSFTLTPNINSATLTLLEVAILISQFINESFQQNLKIKWPNDLVNSDGEKVGGLIATLVHETVCIGLGMNVGANSSRASITRERLSCEQLETLASDLYDYILHQRISDLQTVINEFNQRSIHTNRRVLIVDNRDKYLGQFNGIGSHGEAIIDGKKIYNGSLYWRDAEIDLIS